MDRTELSRMDELLDLLADEVARRLEGRRAPGGISPERAPLVLSVPPAAVAPEVDPVAECQPATRPAPETVTEHQPASEPVAETRTECQSTPEPDPELVTEYRSSPEPASELLRESELASDPAPQPPTEREQETAAFVPTEIRSLTARLAVGVLILLVLINIPLNTEGTALARSIPSSASLALRNGLLVKEEASPDVWVYRDDAFHWISSLDAFEHYGYRWENVHIVEPGFLSRFRKGNPILVLLKCDGSPHIYGLEGGSKRWIVDIPTFQAEGYVWENVSFVPCSYLRGLPDGESIPPGRGSPPPPLP